jgi:hypothetical protein
MFLNSNTSLSMYLFCNSRIDVITLYSGHVCVYYASMLRCWHLVWILVRTDHPCLGVGCHRQLQRDSIMTLCYAQHCLGSTIASMTQYQRRAMAKSPQQRHCHQRKKGHRQHNCREQYKNTGRSVIILWEA